MARSQFDKNYQITKYCLAPEGDPTCIAGAVFTVRNDHLVHVLAITGATSYVDRQMTSDEARATYRELLDRGWANIPYSIDYERTLKVRAYD